MFLNISGVSVFFLKGMNKSLNIDRNGELNISTHFRIKRNIVRDQQMTRGNRTGELVYGTELM